MWVAAIKLSAARRQITCIYHPRRPNFSPISLWPIAPARCLRLSPTRVWAGAVRSRSFSDLKYQVSYLSAGLQAHCKRQRSPSYRPLAQLVLPQRLRSRPRFSSQVDKVSLVKDGSSWEPSEENKLNGSLKVEEIQKLSIFLSLQVFTERHDSVFNVGQGGKGKIGRIRRTIDETHKDKQLLQSAIKRCCLVR